MGLTQHQLAARLNRSQHYVSRAELGDHRLDVFELEAICQALGLSLPQFWAQLNASQTSTSCTPATSATTSKSPLTQRPNTSEIGGDALRRVLRARTLWEEGSALERGQRLSVAQIAEQVGWSADHLRRMLRVTTGTTPHQIQTAARLRHAQTLLRESDDSVTRIALACDFATPSHFAQVFKGAFGCSPRQFRTQCRLENPENTSSQSQK